MILGLRATYCCPVSTATHFRRLATCRVPAPPQSTEALRRITATPRVSSARPLPKPLFVCKLHGTAAAASISSSSMQVERIPCLSDNYSWLLIEGSGRTAVVDPAEFGPVDRVLQDRKLKLDYIINTHHHSDHVGSNMELKAKYGCEIVGPKADKHRIPGISIALGDGDMWQFGDLEVKCYDTPGHTRGHVTYYVPAAKALFPGDTLFLMGCGRLFEGTPAQMFASLSKIKVLPDETAVYTAHEYTQANAKFAITVDPDNADLKERVSEVAELRSKGRPTVPGNLGQEKATNPFLRSDSLGIRRALGLSESASEEETFAATRAAKDSF